MTARLFFSRRTTRTVRAYVVAATLFFLGATLTTPAAAEIRLVLANDFLASNELDDDLYTAALTLDFNVGRYVVRAGENIFTDTENGLRFDETYVHVGRSLPAFGRWQPRLEVGLVHVGRGLLGEDIQNAIHRLIGDDEVHLAYVDGNRLYPAVRLAARRPLPILARYDLALNVDVGSAVGFKDHAQASVSAAVAVLRGVELDVEVGARFSHSSFAALEPRIEELGPYWQAGVTLHDRVSMSWSYNDFGTKSQHFNIAYLVAWGGGGKKNDPGAVNRALARDIASHRAVDQLAVHEAMH